MDYGSSTGHELRDLLAPLTPTEFLAEYWQRRPVFIKGQPEKFLGLFSRQEFDAALQSGARRTDLPSFQINIIAPSLGNGKLAHMKGISPDEVDLKMREGFTVCVNDIGVGDEKLTFFSRMIREQMSYIGSVWFNCYLSPDGSGAGTHFDSAVTTSLQIEGRKRWRYSARPAFDLPISNAQLRGDGTPVWTLPWVGGEPWQKLENVDEATFTEVILEPGDLLYLPAGTWHNAKALGHSLALNLAFSPLSFVEMLAQLIEPEFQSRVEWRASPPPIYFEDIPPSEGLPATVQTYITERLKEMQAYIAGLDPAGPEISAMWRRLTGR